MLTLENVFKFSSHLMYVNGPFHFLFVNSICCSGILFTMLFMERLGRKRTLAGEFFLVAASLALMYICTGR